MKALRLTRWQQPAQLSDAPVPKADAGQVVLRIAGAGVCHSDLHVMDWPAGQFPWRLPFTLGHENTGWVSEIGAGVTGIRVGDPMLVYGAWGCGACRPCRLGRENYCDHAAEQAAFGGGLGTDGGMAEYMLVPSVRFLVPLGSLDPVLAAPLADAGLTPYHAIASARPHLVPGSTAVVIGAGGLGQMAVQLLKATTGTNVIAVDSDPRKLEIARGLGADAVVYSDANAAQAVQHEAGGRVDVVFDMVGADATLALGAKILRAEGRLVIVGLAGGSLPTSFFGLPMGAEIATSYWGTIPELMELVQLAGRGKLRIDAETFSLDQAPATYERLRRGEIRGRAVIVPGR